MASDAAPLDRSRQSAARLRHETRLPVAFTCQLRVGNGAWRLASMVDLSCDGFRLAWLPDCAAGKELWVRLPGLEARQATVRWRDDRGVGCRFARPLHAAVIDFLSRATNRPNT
jgi:hypothetical protein